MMEIRFHGRGGQGTVVASTLLAKALFISGYQVQTFPLFGVERRGAPVEAYLRLSREKILTRSNVYTPDHLLVQDRRLFETVDVVNGLKENGWIVINASELSEQLVEKLKGYRLAWVDATHIAIENGLGTRTQPIINTAMMGAFSRVMQMPPLEAILDVIEKNIPARPAQNVAAAQAAHKQVQFFE